jgi:hypothetical protein
MSLGVCLTDLVERKKIDGARAASMRRLYDDLVARYEPVHGRATAEGMATGEAMSAIEAGFAQAKRRKLLQAKAQLTILRNARTVYDGGTAADAVLPRRAMLASLVRDERAAGVPNVEYRWRNIKQSALAMMYDVLAEHRAGLRGAVRNPSQLDDVVRELSGEATGDLNARELADSWRRTAEYLRGLFNAAGGHIGKLDGWALPHRHDGQAVGALAPDAWIAEVLPRLDRAKMVDWQTGTPLDDAQMTDMLGEMYEAIVSDGWSKRTPGGAGIGAIASRNSEHRVLHFASADDWLQYNERFGQGSPFDAMMSHVERMARDTASMQILGPNPAATIKWMGDLLEQEAATKGNLADRGKAGIGRYEIEAVWNEVQGQNRRVVRRNLALFGSTIRNWQSATKLGSATIASISDHATKAMTRAYNGLPATELIGQYVKQLNPVDGGDRAFARRSGIIGDEFTGRMAAHGRMHMEDAFGGRLSGGAGKLTRRMEAANEISRRMADGVMRASGLNAHTNAVREAMGMEFMNALTSYAPLSYDGLNPAFRGFLQRYGIDPAGWDAIRATPTVDYKGAAWIKPENIADAALRDRFMEGMLSEIDFAVPTGGLYMRAMVHAARPGTIPGEIIRTGFQFKMFPVTVVAMHGARALAQSNLSKRATYAVAFLGATTISGALAYQLSEIAKGKDPRPMTEGDFWWRATLKGGGLGVFGDAIEFSRNEFGQDLFDITKGPTASTATTLGEVANAASYSAYEAVYADDPEVAEKAAKLRGKATRHLLTREVPGSSLWYIRAAYERLLVDQVAAWAGEDRAANARTLERRAKEQGNRYFMRPGDAMQEWRAPDMSSALENRVGE